MKTLVDIGVLVVVVSMMVAVGLGLELRHFRSLRGQLRPLAVNLAAQAILLPLLGLATISFMPLPPHLAAGLLLVAACPVGDIANLYTLVGGGNVALAVTVNTLSCCVAMLTMSVAFEIYRVALGGSFSFAIPTPSLVLKLVLMVWVPLAVGMAARRCFPRAASVLERVLRNFSVVGVLALLVCIMSSQRARLATEWYLTAGAGVLLMVGALGAGLLVGRLCRLCPRDAMTVGLLFMTRNVGLASAIAVTLLGHVEYAVFAAVYFTTETPVAFLFIALHRFWTASRSTSTDGSPT